MAPPGSPKTSVTPSSSRDLTTASAPVSTGEGAEAVRAGGRGTAVTESAVMMGAFVSDETERMSVAGSPRGGALGSGADETGVLGKDATGIARRKGLPAFTAGAQLCL